MSRRRESKIYFYVFPYVLPRYFSGARFPNGLSIASDLLSDSVKRALLSVKGSHKSETVRQKQTPHAVNQAFCQLAQGTRLPATFLTPRTLCIRYRGESN